MTNGSGHHAHDFDPDSQLIWELQEANQIASLFLSERGNQMLLYPSRLGVCSTVAWAIMLLVSTSDYIAGAAESLPAPANEAEAMLAVAKQQPPEKPKVDYAQVAREAARQVEADTAILDKQLAALRTELEHRKAIQENVVEPISGLGRVAGIVGQSIEANPAVETLP